MTLFVILLFLPDLLLQAIYTGLTFLLCAYACYQHLSRTPQFTYFTNGYIQFSDAGAIWRISRQSLCSDLFIILICKNSKLTPKVKKRYIMRDAVADADYRRLTRTIKMLAQDD